jgi:hypothetical protein
MYWFNSLFSWSNWIDIEVVLEPTEGYYHILQGKVNSITNSKKFRLVPFVSQSVLKGSQPLAENLLREVNMIDRIKKFNFEESVNLKSELEKYGCTTLNLFSKNELDKIKNSFEPTKKSN